MAPRYFQALLLGATFLSHGTASSLVSRADITACPGGESTTALKAGNRIFSICPGTDYWSPNTATLPNVATVDDCATRCAQATGCEKASYNTKTQTCYLKGAPATPIWFTTPDLATIRVANVNKCPSQERSSTVNNARLTICAGTDYWSPNVKVIPGVTSVDDCAKQCAGDAGCAKASYNSKQQTCYLKGTPASPIWFSTGDLDTISVIRSSATPSSASPSASATATNTASPKPSTVGNNPGKWGKVFPLPVIPVAGYVVPEWPESNRLLFWSAWGANKFSLWAPPNGYTQFADYNYKTGVVGQRNVSETKHDMFCPGVSSLADGRIIITGGTNAEVTSIYEPATNKFVRGPDMKIPRGYQTSVTISDGRVFTVGGSFSGARGGKTGEIYDPATNTWRILPGARVEPILTSYDWEGDWRTDNHAWLFPWTDGSILQAGPSKGMHWYSTSGDGSIQDAGTRDSEADAMCGVHVMYDVGKIFSAGGSQSYTASPATARAHLITITEAYQNPNVERLPDMNDPRGFANVVVLPNGQVMVTGGQHISRVFEDINSVLTPELFDPASKTFRRLAPHVEPRNYHSIAILLGDGTVFTGGGGMCGNINPGDPETYCDRAIDHQNGEIYSPPYLFNDDMTPATRPIIFDVVSNDFANGRTVKVGGTITVHLNYPKDHTLVLVRIGSVTHSVNSDQRRIPLTNVKRDQAAFTATLPSDSGIVIPGFYYLFAMDERGVPSVARTLQVIL
ncbi:hypothetical protein NX059_002149 [Plenodomus lindquistii]|nr:hypothetical protein NX059_002149 [Plenodomus lindquistii]